VQGGTTRWYGDQSVYFGTKRAIKLRIPQTGNKQRFASMTMSQSYNVLYKERKVFRDGNDRKKSSVGKNVTEAKTINEKLEGEITEVKKK
jgi:hypothetical protein